MAKRIAIIAFILALIALGLNVYIFTANAATTNHYRRPITVLIGINPRTTHVYRCHNMNHKIPRVFGFGGCKEIK